MIFVEAVLLMIAGYIALYLLVFAGAYLLCLGAGIARMGWADAREHFRDPWPSPKPLTREEIIEEVEARR